MSKKIFILEDDENIRDLVCYTLNQTGYECTGFEKPSELKKVLDSVTPELLLLDILLPEENGLEVLKELRRVNATKNLPVIFLTAKTTEYDKVIGLDLGADDYLTKPFGMMELLSRIRAVLRRSLKSNEDSLEISGIYINSDKHEVLIEDKNIELTKKEYKLLKYLFENKDYVISRDKLLNKIWGYDYDGDNRTVDVHIRSLRKKLGAHKDVIKTVRGFGYKAVELEP